MHCGLRCHFFRVSLSPTTCGEQPTPCSRCPHLPPAKLTRTSVPQCELTCTPSGLLAPLSPPVARCAPLRPCRVRSAAVYSHSPHTLPAARADLARRPGASADVLPFPFLPSFLHSPLPCPWSTAPCPCLDPFVWFYAHPPSPPISYSFVALPSHRPFCLSLAVIKARIFRTLISSLQGTIS